MSFSVRWPVMELEWLTGLIRAFTTGRDIEDGDPEDGGAYIWSEGQDKS